MSQGRRSWKILYIPSWAPPTDCFGVFISVSWFSERMHLVPTSVSVWYLHLYTCRPIDSLSCVMRFFVNKGYQ